MIEVPFKDINPETLSIMIEEFVTRDGTDYGIAEVAVEKRVATVMKQIESGKVRIVFDEESESCNLVNKDDLDNLLKRV